MKLSHALLYLFLQLVFLHTIVVHNLYADIYLLKKRHVDSFEVMGAYTPAKDEYITIWISQNIVRQDTGSDTAYEDSSVLSFLEEGKHYSLNHEMMSYFDLTSTLQGMDYGEVRVSEEETNEEKVINGWNCKKYIRTVVLGSFTTISEAWVTDDIDIDYDLYHDVMTRAASLTPGLEQMKENEIIKGIEVYNIIETEISGVTVKMTEELLDVEEISAPPDLFRIPDDYVEQTFGLY